VIGRGATDSPEQQAHRKLMDLLTQARKARRPFDEEAWLNLAFFLGEQYTEWDKQSDNIRRIPRKVQNDEKGQVDETDLPRPILNKIQHFIYTAHAETLQDKPSADVLPATDDYMAALDQDVNKAYLNYVMEPVNANWDLQLSIATLWALITPSGWLKWVWDPVMQRPDMIPVPFFDLAVDPYAKQFARARYAIHSMYLDPDQISEAFDVTVDKDEVGVQDSLKVELLRGMGAAPVTKGVEVHELWMRPSKKNPEGLYALFTNKRILKMERRLPYKHLRDGAGMLPFTQLGSLLRPDSMYYTTPVTALRPAQMVWNKFVAQAILIQENFAGPKWWIAEELQMQNMPNSSPRQILRGNAGNTGLKPELIQPPSMPDSSRLLDIFEKQMMHVVSVHEVSEGQVPGRVEAAKAIELLQTSDKGRYKHLLDTIDQAISVGWWQALMLAREFESEEKFVMAYSREGVPMVKRWRKGAVHPGMRIRVVRMGGLGRTRAERQDNLLLLWQNGIIKDPDLMAELMDVPIPSFTNARANDMRKARAENILMADGKAVVPGSWENHAIHIREHNEYRKTFEFDALGIEAKRRFEFHVERHKALQIQAALELATLQRAAQGIPPGAGAPGGPPQPGQTPPGADPAGPGTEAAPEQSQEPGPPSQGPAPPGAGAGPQAGQ
jgi:hypothetical protein